MNLPNFLTAIRFLLVPVMTCFLVSKDFTLAIIIYILASITDVLDGYIARKYNMITKLGKILDPMADKLLQFSALVGLWVVNVIPFWITLIFFLKEIFMGLGAIKLLKNKDVVVPSAESYERGLEKNKRDLRDCERVLFENKGMN